jgi:putative intracellular protease/amidase
MAPKILIVLTSVGTLANGGPTGWYLVSNLSMSHTANR